MATKRELIDKQLDTYKGLMKDLDYNIHNAEVNMKYELQGKIRMITTIKDSRQQGDIINQSSLIYNFMDQQLGKPMMEILIKERTAYNLKLMENFKIEPPAPSKDQNYIYDGSVGPRQNKPTYFQYADTINRALKDEASFLSTFFKDDFQTLRVALGRIMTPLFDMLLANTKTFLKFIDGHHFTYDTLNYELYNGIVKVMKTMEFYGTEMPRGFLEAKNNIHIRCENAFKNFFVFVDQRYQEVIITDHQSETLNSAFMTTMTRLNKFSKFSEDQLIHIASTPINSWLPPTKPMGFQEVKVNSNDPHFLLSSFYSDN
ncbi:unnamed protein product [Ambrosiozyma monospora]|uniref:Unnamed protein product n=1 Tax=Ambrosiozyma monospora TaxID=43982 RepID=A0ACB5U9D3_AMBMO|nr:unnamed protein product [Ambrosiozyma monospora]